MNLCNIIVQYFLFISFCYCHNLNHADPVTVKQTESTIIVENLSKNIEITNVESTNNVKKPAQNVNEQQIQSTTPSVDISEQKTIPKLIVTTTQSHIPSTSNSNKQDIKLEQQSQIPLKTTTTVVTPSVVEQESHPSRTSRHHQKVHVHPRHVQTNPQPIEIISESQPTITIENKTQTNDQPINNTDIPHPKLILKSDILTTTTTTSIPSISDTNSQLVHTTSNETIKNISQPESTITQVNNSISIPSIPNDKNRQICWHLPKKFESSIELLENQIFRFINVLPDFLQTIFFGPINDREILMNTMWFGSICTMCFLFSFFFLTMGTKRLKQNKYDKEVRARCQQLQQYNNQITLERATFERQNQKLTDEIDELKNLPVRDTDEDIFTLRTECIRFQEDIKTIRLERDTLQNDLDQKQNLIQKYEYDLKGQVDIITHLNNQIVQLKQELEKERSVIIRLQSNDLSLERFEKSQEIIQELKSEITQLKQEKFLHKDQLDEIQQHANQLDTDNNQLTLKMRQLKDYLEQREQIIKTIYDKIQIIDRFESDDLLLFIKENSLNKEFVLNIDHDIEKSSQHIQDLHSQINDKTYRIKELENLFKQEKDRCKETETKLKVILELRERDAHLHIRQLGQTDAELRKARTDTDRVRILQQQLESKQQQLDDTQKVLSSEQMKFNEECSKLQHDTHEKWMEVKRLTRELDSSKKECEGLRKQITKYANNERSSQEKVIVKPVPQHYGELETNNRSPISYQQGENFRPIDHQRNDSGATSPVEMFLPRPPPFGLSRPPFFPGPFLPHPPPNAFMMHPRFPMPNSGPHGLISPLAPLTTNGSDANNSEIIDSQSSEVLASPATDDEKPKKTKKSLKKKSRTSVIKENV